jgi:hypothetical protein
MNVHPPKPRGSSKPAAAALPPLIDLYGSDWKTLQKKTNGLVQRRDSKNQGHPAAVKMILRIA